MMEGATVEAKVVKNGKGKKIDIIRYKAKKGEKRHIGQAVVLYDGDTVVGGGTIREAIR